MKLDKSYGAWRTPHGLNCHWEKIQAKQSIVRSKCKAQLLKDLLFVQIKIPFEIWTFSSGLKGYF